MTLLNLLKEYGLGPQGFLDRLWWKNEPFAFEEPVNDMHPAKIAQTLLINQEISDYWVKSSRKEASGHRIVLKFEPTGLSISTVLDEDNRTDVK